VRGSPSVFLHASVHGMCICVRACSCVGVSLSSSSALLFTHSRGAGVGDGGGGRVCVPSEHDGAECPARGRRRSGRRPRPRLHHRGRPRCPPWCGERVTSVAGFVCVHVCMCACMCAYAARYSRPRAGADHRQAGRGQRSSCCCRRAAWATIAYRPLWPQTRPPVRPASPPPATLRCWYVRTQPLFPTAAVRARLMRRPLSVRSGHAAERCEMHGHCCSRCCQLRLRLRLPHRRH
jgi:hypothetical protein